ncbi:co-chaperone GroES [Lacipirellula parvula]|uniref:Co-chaperonin GroES n=1 Tax=Lacipirellula parvula TaxID=2650471 RepID=A0A5K7XI40_9BACT|nr:co-chaperone GroES [Lacipirellula parvula]BBO36564.1 heat shock protein 60 family co-chaperone GroES [Lacipirellula parvula]
MKVVPLGDKLVVKRLESAEKTAGGILLPDAAREQPQQGRVLSVGDGLMLPDGTRAPHEVNEGDRVVFSSYSGAEVTIDEEKLLILNADDILAIVR